MTSATNTGLTAYNKKIPLQKKQTNREAMSEFRLLQKKRIRLWSIGQNLSKEEDFRLRQLIARFNFLNK